MKEQPGASPVAAAPGPHPLRGVLVGMLPLALLAVLVAVALLATLVTRLLAAPQGFFAQQQFALIALVVGLLIAATAYVAGVARAFQRIGQWQRDGATGAANAALIALALTALVVLLPLLVAVLLPQHPAP